MGLRRSASVAFDCGEIGFRVDKARGVTTLVQNRSLQTATSAEMANGKWQMADGKKRQSAIGDRRTLAEGEACGFETRDRRAGSIADWKSALRGTTEKQKVELKQDNPWGLTGEDLRG